jgi:exonuclease SbcC
MKPIILEMQAFGPFAHRQVIDFRELGERTFFLIHGPTGSGKTTILDGICYALFGDSSGGEREGREMRSHHADHDTLTEVCFDFELGDKRYRVRRIPEQIRPAKRGDKETRQTLKAELWHIEGSDEAEVELPLASGASKVNEAVVRLLGFESAQFRQVIMLPQGKFREFLVSNTQEREKILQTLFGTEIYKRIEDALRVSANELSQLAKEVRTQRQTLLDQAEVADEPTLGARLEQQTAELKTHEVAEKSAADAAAAKEKQLTEARIAASKFVELDAALQALNQLDTERPGWEAKRLELAAARRASVVRPLEKAMLETKAECDGEVARGKALAGEQAQAQTTKAAADERLDQEKSRSSEADTLVGRIAELDGLVEKVNSLATAMLDLAAAEKAHCQAAAALKTAQDTQQRTLEASRNLDVEIQRLRVAVAGVEGSRVLHAQLKSRQTQLTTLAKLQKDIASGAKDLEQRQSALKKAEANHAAAQATRDTTHRIWVASQAARLAGELAEGRACPVCGSHEHPSPAHGEGELVQDDALDAANQVVTLAQAALREAEMATLSAQESHRSLEARIADTKTTLGEAALLSADEIQVQVDAASAALVTAEAAVVALKAQEGLVARIEQEHKVAETAVAALTKKSSDAQAWFQELTGRVQERAGSVPAQFAEPGVLASTREAAVNAHAALKTAMEKATQAANKAASDLSAAAAKVEVSGKTFERLTAQFNGKVAEFEAVLNANQFETPEAYRRAWIEEQGIAALETSLRAFDGSLKAAGERHERSITGTRDLARPDVALIEANHEMAKSVHLDAVKTVQAARSSLAVTADFVESLKKLADSYQSLEARHALLRQVSDVANGANEQRMSFQRYVLATLLEEVLVAATLRLKVMSRGRYEMRRRVEAVNQRTAAGLDLEVFDHYTGSSRGVSTLSGGESFLASLALALGLSDVVQSYAGGIRLDAIFVDEGFGTLDSESLDFAIRALKDLQQAGRVVGIISHVAELKEWIDARLELKAGPEGSHAVFLT